MGRIRIVECTHVKIQLNTTEDLTVFLNRVKCENYRGKRTLEELNLCRS